MRMTECLQDQNNYLIDTSTPETLERDFYAWLNTDYPPNYSYPSSGYMYSGGKMYYAPTNYTTSTMSCSGDEAQSDRSSPNLSSSPQSIMGENVEYNYYNYPAPMTITSNMVQRDDIYTNGYPNISQNSSLHHPLQQGTIMGNGLIGNNYMLKQNNIHQQHHNPHHPINGGMIMNCNDNMIRGGKISNNTQINNTNFITTSSSSSSPPQSQQTTSSSSSSSTSTTTTTTNCTPPSNQGRSSGTNQLGRTYSPGLPLSMGEREQIVALYQNGWKICDISKKLCVTHSCVSKILNRFRLTGSVRPKDAKEGRVESPLVIAIRDYRFRLGMTRQSEIREQLIADGICSRENAPSRSSINHILRTKLDIKKKPKIV
ncbi:Paired domain and Homeodomain-like and Winged helix-turn-helix DNA-binding domain-containing protein [Strongyloides ratti]|uniref:Paired domain and Homeodomain-like and Winged helix-turn-helix DNA-binding domain-containing protein n=1 Tax=Strongyloides ratti TaxID=34506 RepID=A0A090MV95_STRRB|nr:Paired domain and Homeodomain-like and Winged helix-turn-helix DNA-binding domain-containing protein [Strongyloides ratti]CEF62748.1 Paired domain and Homeodomain-like and Winged helix-turn-helix DNA-binding domain-containing protein [Strongyloides ratti]